MPAYLVVTKANHATFWSKTLNIVNLYATRIAVLATVVGLPLVAHASPANLLTNGSFEASGGSFAGWTITGGGTTPGTGPQIIATNGVTSGPYGDVIPSDPFTFGPDPAGTHGAYFVDDSANETLSQSVNVIAGQLYELGFDLYATRSGAANRNPFTLTASFAGVPITAATSASVVPVSTWIHFSDTFTALATGPVDYTFVFTAGAQPAKDVVVDEVYAVAGRVTPAPEPASLAGLGVGLLGLGMIRRRKA